MMERGTLGLGMTGWWVGMMLSPWFHPSVLRRIWEPTLPLVLKENLMFQLTYMMGQGTLGPDKKD